ncbi:MAG: STAS domain-containing protein [Planctomycetota bacterium]
METTREPHDRAVVLAVAGRRDFGPAKDFAATRTVCIGDAAAGGLGLILDLGGVDYVSSAGLRSLMVGAKTAKAQSVGFHVCCLAQDVAEVFRISGLDQIIQPLADRAAAEAHLQP